MTSGTNIEMAIGILFLFLFIVDVSQTQSMYTEVIQTKSGKIRGQLQSSSLPGVKIQKFRNIPYAEAPTGPLRYEKPQAKKPWNGTLNSTDVNIACFQEYSAGYNLTEDCLILNIWTPYPQPKNATVMVYIHGGSFTSGSSGEPIHNGANFVAVGNVVLVTINYRLSVLGFLSTGDERIKGNLGLYDQRLAMKWVKENIEAFGGNPETITLFGLSAGAASVSAHTLSKESWPYFDRVILQSGNMLTPWTNISEADIKAVANAFLKVVNCPNDDRVVECLKTNVTEEILNTIYTTKPFLLKLLRFSPRVDGEFLKDSPNTLFTSGKVKKFDIILGNTKDEMFFIYHDVIRQTRNTTIITKNFTDLVKSYFKSYSEEVLDHAIKLYTPKCKPNFIEALRPMIDIGSDIIFVCATRTEAVVRSKLNHKVYLYKYSYATAVPYPAYPRGQFGFAAHGADLLSSFGFTINNPRFPQEDQILSMRIILYWTNFAKTGDPNIGNTTLPLVLNNINTLPTWPPHTTGKQEYLDMRSLSEMVIETNLRKEYCEFLRDPEGVTAKARAKDSASRNVGHFMLLGAMFLYNIL